MKFKEILPEGVEQDTGQRWKNANQEVEIRGWGYDPGVMSFVVVKGKGKGSHKEMKVEAFKKEFTHIPTKKA